jgi:hypothetical protein
MQQYLPQLMRQIPGFKSPFNTIWPIKELAVLVYEVMSANSKRRLKHFWMFDATSFTDTRLSFAKSWQDYGLIN